MDTTGLDLLDDFGIVTELARWENFDGDLAIGVLGDLFGQKLGRHVGGGVGGENVREFECIFLRHSLPGQQTHAEGGNAAHGSEFHGETLSFIVPQLYASRMPRSKPGQPIAGRIIALNELMTLPKPTIPNRRFTRLVQGAGRFVANAKDMDCLHVKVLRSPVAHADSLLIDCTAAKAMPGVEAVLLAADLAEICPGWQARHALFPDAQLPIERPLAAQKVTYVGEPLALVIAQSAVQAEAALEAVKLEFNVLPPFVTVTSSLADDASPIHAEFTDNIYLKFQQGRPGPSDGHGVHLNLSLARISGQSLETRAVIADYDAIEDRLTVRQSHQHPHQMQDIYSRFLGIPEHRVRVICDDVGGAFGTKQQLYPDEMAVIAAAKKLKRKLSLIVDRSESLISDAQAREHDLQAVCTIDPVTGKVSHMTLDDRCAIGAFPHYPRTSVGESGQASKLLAAPYDITTQTHSTLAFQNKPPFGHYRGVGHPIACLVTEALMDKAARLSGMDPVAFRRRQLHDPAQLPVRMASGIEIDRFRLAECLDRLDERLAPWRGSQPPVGQLRGIGVACLLELCASGSGYYGEGQVRISVNESCQLRMEPSGVVRVATANTDQGQGADQAIAQIVATVLDLPTEKIEVTSGDTANCPYGGGAFASRGTAIGGAAARDAALNLRAQLLTIAGLLLQCAPSDLDLKDGKITQKSDGAIRYTLPELAAICHFKPHLLPPEQSASLAVIGQARPARDFQICTAAFAAIVDIDMATGVPTLQHLIVAHDGGTLINPDAVDAQLQGGLVQGMGQALMEAMRYDANGQPLAGSWMDYAMPRADQVPAIDIVHLPPGADEVFSPRGVGEAGISGAPAAIFNAINDALSPFDTAIEALPATSQMIWQALQTSQQVRKSSSNGS